jgi:hypothetical protein
MAYRPVPKPSYVINPHDAQILGCFDLVCWVCRSVARQFFVAPLNESSLTSLTPCLQTRQARNIHSVPELKTHGKVFRENGIPPFLSLEAYRLAWRDYQGMLVEKLNRLTFGMAPLKLTYTIAPHS